MNTVSGYYGLSRWLSIKNLPVNAEVTRDATPGSGSLPGVVNGKPLQFSCQDNATDREDWWATAHGLQRVRHD